MLFKKKKKKRMIYIKFVIRKFIYLLAMPRGIWGLSPLTRA